MLAAVIFFVRLFSRVGDVDLMTDVQVTTCLFCKSTLALVVIGILVVVVIHGWPAHSSSLRSMDWSL